MDPFSGKKTTGQRQHIKITVSAQHPSIHILVVTWYPLHIGSVDSPVLNERSL